MERDALLRELPAVDEVLRHPEVNDLVQRWGRPVVVEAVRAVIDRARHAVRTADPGGPPPPLRVDDAAVRAEVRSRVTFGLRPVINATGVVLHTNLGRAPLAAEAVHAAGAAGRYASLETDLASGARGRREVHVAGLLRELLGCEDAVVVNNCAAAVMLVLRSLAEGREVIVSRGELVEIGGGFRVPEVLAQSGARLVEVGTTNRTRLSDYERALTPETGAILKVHRSNFAVVGFSESVPVAALSGLAQSRGIPLIHDQGTGLLRPGLLPGESSVRESLESGADVVCFSGDKLLGGPQAGVIAGRRDRVEAAARHPLMRALRCDKLTLGALEATLRLYRDGFEDRIPLVQMLRADATGLDASADRLARRLAEAGIPTGLIEVEDAVGGGSAPLVRLPGVAVEIPTGDPDALAARLRTGDPAIVGVIREGALRLHVRTVPEDRLEALADGVVAAWSPPAGG